MLNKNFLFWMLTWHKLQFYRTFLCYYNWSCEKLHQKVLEILKISFSHSLNKNYITAKYDGHWWLGCILQIFPDTNEVEINFLHPHGPAQSYRYPHPADILVMSCQDLLTTVQPTRVKSLGEHMVLSDIQGSYCSKPGSPK